MTINIRIPSGRAAEFIEAEAERRGCHPAQFALALISCAAAADLADAILDGARPADFDMPKAGRKPTLYPRVLVAMSRHDAPIGTIRVTSTDIGRALGVHNRGSILRAKRTLRQLGLIVALDNAKGGRGIPAAYRITERGHELLAKMRRES